MVTGAEIADVPVLHVDEDLIVLDKPAGLLAVPGRGPDKQDCLSARVQGRWPDARVVHRLDMATSGLMLMARQAQSQRWLSQAFEARKVHKQYLAVVHGVVDARYGEQWHCIDLPLAADWPQRPRQRIDEHQGRPSQTRWQVLERKTQTTRLLLEPITGRSHQLRVHLQALGHPIVGDALYGPDRPAPEARLLLHAHRLNLPHPRSGEPLSFESLAPF